MHAISAADAVSLAIQRTRDFLFRPFSWGTYLKLGLVAILTENMGGNFRSSPHGSAPSGHGPVFTPPFGHGPAFTLPHLAPQWIAAFVAIALLVLVLSFVIAYLIIRLRFAYLHCLIHDIKEIRPGWYLYRTQALRFFLLNLVVGLCFLVVVVLLAIPFVAGFVRLIQGTQQGNPPDIGLVLSLLLPLIPIVLLLFLAAFLTNMILHDWILPHFALDDATTGEAWSQIWAHILAEKRQFFVYALLRLALPIVAAVGMFLLLAIPGLILAGSVAAIEFGIHSTFADATGASALVGKLLEVFFGVLALGFALLAGICLGGPLGTGIREYALIFYGGRYPELGDALYPPPPQTAIL
jgi:hypothetical protein